MSILKSKVARALQKTPGDNSTNQIIITPIKAPSASSKNKISIKSIPASKKRHSTIDDGEYSPVPYKKERSPNKNIVKNYARAMINFAVSELSLPYLENIIEEKDGRITMEEFKLTLQTVKEKINSITTLRSLLLILEEDTDQLVAFKEAFRDICEVFVKMFSVNWIYSSKLSDKMIHLKYRFKILRRIRDPESFTYLENFSKRH